MPPPLTQQEEFFCLALAQTRSAREAAARAGYKNPQKDSLKLLARKEIRRAAQKAEAAPPNRAEIAAGYRRLAFGCCTDALRLLFLEQEPSLAALEQLDLFNVSDIKRPKGGGLEIRFFDRCEALQALEAFCGAEEEEKGARAFYEALSRSVQPNGKEEKSSDV
jgi:hypothetical protein